MSTGEPTSPGGSYLQQRQAQAAIELAEAERQLEGWRAEMQKHYPPCEQAAGAMQAIVLASAARHAAKLGVDARRAARGQAFSLRALVPGGKWRLLAWCLLWLVLPWICVRAYLHWYHIPYAPDYAEWFVKLVRGRFTRYGLAVMFVPPVIVYAGLVKWGIARKGRRDSRQARDAVREFGRRKLSLMHFDERESGDSRFPYAATRAPWPNQDVTTHWNIAAEYGRLFDADLVAFHAPQDGEALHSLLLLPSQDRPARLIPLGDSGSKPEWPWQERLAADVAPQLAGHAAAIRALAERAQVVSRGSGRVAALRQRIRTLEDVRRNWTDVAIEEQTLDQVLKLVDLFVSGRKPSPKGILLYGPPGTGKTLIARKLAKHAGCHFESVNIADLKGQHIGQTAPRVKAVWERCRKHAPALLFVDECESAFARRGGTDTDSFGNELVQSFISEWDGFNQSSGQVLVIGATNRRDILDDAVVSRFTAMVEIGLPGADARQRILANELRQAGVEVELTAGIVSETSGMSGRDLHTLVASVIADHLDRNLTPESLLGAVRRVRGKGSTRVDEKSWEDIVLPPATLEEFESLGAELRDAEQMTKLGIPPPAGILLYGPPGTGKTQIARVLACQAGLSFVGASTADMKANYIGQSGSKVKALFERARSQAPCILFLDEIDIVAPSRESGGDTFTQEIVGQLLQELDGVATRKGQVFLLCASNHPDRIDGALLSRLDRKVRIDLPDPAARARIIALELKSKPLAFEVGPVAEALAAKTGGFSGRDLHKLVARATRKAVTRARRDGGSAVDARLVAGDLEDALAERDGPAPVETGPDGMVREGVS